jgi:ABC-2 type transport system permease protein
MTIQGSELEVLPRPPRPARRPLPQWRREAQLVGRLTSAALARFAAVRLFGLWWWIVDPLVMIGVYVFVFDVLLGAVGRDVSPTYPLFLCCGIIPWRWFSIATTRGSNAFIGNGALLRSTPISRKVVVLSELLASTVEALMGVAVLLGFMLYYRLDLTWNLAWLPVPLLVMGVLIAGVSLVLCPLTVLVRDLDNVFAAGMRALWFLSPGLYSLDQVPERYRETYAALNPFAGLMEGVRRPIHDGLPPDWVALGWSAAWAVGVLVVGRWVFRRFKNQAIRML